MLPKENRLNLTKEFYKIKKRSWYYQTPIFKLLYQNSAETSPKIGFVVSSSIGKAVKRNRVKRILAQEVSKLLPKFPKNTRVVFIAKQNIINVSNEEISAFVNQVLSKISK